VLAFLDQNLDKIGPLLDKPISEMQEVFTDVPQITESQPTIEAFNMMAKEGIHGVAVVNDAGVIVGTLSVRDLKAMAPDGSLFWRLYGSAKNFLQKLHSEYAGVGRPFTVQTCTENDTLKTVIRRLATNKIHRIFIVNEKNVPIGVVALRDVFNEILSK